MVSEEKYIVSLRKHIFSAPSPAFSLLVFLGVIGLFSYLLHQNIHDVLLLFIAPYLITIALDYYSIRALRIYFPLNRVSALNLFTFMVAFVQFWILNYLFGFYMGFYLAFSSVIYPRFIIYRTFLSEKKCYSLLVSAYYSIVLIVITLLFLPYSVKSFLAATVVYLIIGYLMIRTSTAPFRREFREDPLFFVSAFINYMARLSKEDLEKLNRFFYGIYEYRKVPISAIVFKNQSGIKAVFLAPYIHPGPFGEVGGSDISTKLEKILNMDNLMVFHTTTTHDNNVATDEDVRKIADTVRRLLDGECEYTEMSDIVRFEVGGHGVMAQRFGQYAFIALLPTRAEFDDVELNTGIMLMHALRDKFRDVMAIDAHNNFNENSLPLTLTQRDAHKIRDALRTLKNKYRIKMGYGAVKFEGHSIGPGGIRAAVFECGTKKCGYVLIDGNNIKEGLTEKIKKAVAELADVEVFSTDNHVVNVTMMDLNPVGTEDNWDKIIESAKAAVQNAIENMEEVCVYMKTEWVELRMAASGQLAKMTDITKESMKVAKIAVPLLSAGGFIISFLIFYLGL
ncbi:MAG: DUF2070 family protein [Euryarchaeota archaeon]|nr:DUF2070 family protein [Euryarchaeota archaeon]